MDYIIFFLYKAIDIYTYVIFASVIVSWLIGFNIISLSNKIIYKIVMIIRRLTEPVFESVRTVIPSFFGLDFSPVIILLTLQGLKMALVWVYFNFI
ncbi:MAG: YggT family protein [Alphaproteobacteria bacterium]